MDILTRCGGAYYEEKNQCFASCAAAPDGWWGTTLIKGCRLP
jgi:hypothetical protein